MAVSTIFKSFDIDFSNISIGDLHGVNPFDCVANVYVFPSVSANKTIENNPSTVNFSSSILPIVFALTLLPALFRYDATNIRLYQQVFLSV